MKWQRRYLMTIEGRSGEIWTPAYPFTCKFKVVGVGSSTPNQAHFTMYNLPKNVRQDIGFDVGDDSTYRRLTFAAGYLDEEPNLTVIFAGNVTFCYTFRQGPDWITEIDCLDGGWAISNSGTYLFSFPKNTGYVQYLTQVAQGLSVDSNKPIPIGVISPNLGIPTNKNRGSAFVSNPWAELVRQTLPLNAKLFINKEVLYILAQNEYLQNTNGLTIFSPDTGMIGSPRVNNLMLIATILFEPRLQVCQQITLQTSLPYGGNYEVQMIEHRGTVSPVEAGDYTTTCTFFRYPDAAIVVGEAN